jgi:hypothetical protein
VATQVAANSLKYLQSLIVDTDSGTLDQQFPDEQEDTAGFFGVGQLSAPFRRVIAP